MALTKRTSSKQSEENQIAQLDVNKKKKSRLTRVVIHCDVGFNNSIFIRGNGANLSWDKGIMLLNTRFDEWVWETNQPFDSCEFKVLINDLQYEQGNNHILTCGNCVEYTPQFF
jgi:hypothetical protein